MFAYILRRLVLLVPVLIGVSLVSFALMQLVPGDPALILAGEEASEEVLARIRQEYGLNRPLPVQFLAYLRHAVAGNLGISIQSRQPVSTLLAQRFPFTLKLALLAILVSATLGVIAGIVAATHRNSSLDIAALLGSLVGISLPIFSLPGVGRLIVEGIFARDYPVVQGALLVVATTFVLVNLLTDIAYAYFDPRIHYN